LFKSGNKDGELEFDCLIVNDNPDTIYRHYCFTNNNNKNCFEIGRYIYNKLENIADKELEEYVAQNINNTEFYQKTARSLPSSISGRWETSCQVN